MKWEWTSEDYTEVKVRGDEIIISAAIELTEIIEDMRYALIKNTGQFHYETANALERIHDMLCELGLQNDEVMKTLEVYCPKGYKVVRIRNPYWNGESRKGHPDDNPNVDRSGAAFNDTSEEPPF